MIAVIVFVASLAPAQGQQCYVRGSLADTYVIGHATTDSYNSCLKSCQSNDNCNYFTFHKDSLDCLHYEFYNYIDLCMESECLSGQANCPEVEDPQCQVEAECSGSYFIGWTEVDSYDDCLTDCKNNEMCGWFTFYGGTQECFQYVDCFAIEDECQRGDCITGQKQC